MLPSTLLTGAVLGILGAVAVRGMVWVRILDVPDARKAHATPTPTAGGIGVLSVVVLAPVLLPALRSPHLLGLLAIASLLGVISLTDDVRARPVTIKFLAQTSAALAAVLLGLRIGPASWGVIGGIVTVVWIIAITNAVNFIDGADGLAPGVLLLACVILLAVAPAGGAAAGLALALAAGLAGFLPFNWPRARIFLGDAGSQPIGFLLACLGLLLPAGHAALLPALLSGVLFDVGFTLVQRALAGARLTVAHRDHLYQRAALPPGHIAPLHWGFVLWGALCWYSLGTPLAPAVPTLILGPQLAWLAIVQARAHPPKGMPAFRSFSEIPPA